MFPNASRFPVTKGLFYIAEGSRNAAVPRSGSTSHFLITLIQMKVKIFLSCPSLISWSASTLFATKIGENGLSSLLAETWRFSMSQFEWGFEDEEQWKRKIQKIAARTDVQKTPKLSLSISFTLFDFAGYLFSKAEVSAHFCTFLPKLKRESRKAWS